MTTQYTSLLGLALPVTGELSGTWGDTVNNGITSLLDSAIAGTTTLSSDADVTLSNNDGTADTSRQAILLWTAGGTVTRTITAPALSKIYTVINASSSTQSIKVVGAGPTTGVTIIKGEAAMIAWNGSDFVKVSNTGGSFTTQDLTVTGNTILGDAITDTTTLNAQTRFQSRAILGYANMTGPATTSLTTTAPAFLYSGATTYTVSDVSGGTQTHAPIISLGQATITNASTNTIYTNAQTLYIGGAPNAAGLVTFQRPYALYLDSGTTTASAAVTYTNAATLYIAGAPTAGANVTLTTPYALYVNAGNVYLGGGTASGVAYLDTNKVLTTGSALVFDATNTALSVGGAALGTAANRTVFTLNATTSNFLSFGIGGTRVAHFYSDANEFAIANAAGASGFITMQTNGAERMRIASATGGVGAVGIGYTSLTSVGDNGLAVLGNVGIGTSSPAARLHVSTTSSNISIAQSSAANGGYLEFSNGSTSPLYVGFGATLVTGISTSDAALRYSNNLVFGNGGSEVARFISGGNLGLGTTSPNAQIEVSRSSTSGYSTFRLSNSGASGKTYEIGVGGNAAAAGYANSLYFYDSSASALRFVFGPSGQFGIGGATYGNAGEVLTSGGSGAAPTWAAAGGGGTTNGKLYFYSSFN